MCLFSVLCWWLVFLKYSQPSSVFSVTVFNVNFSRWTWVDRYMSPFWILLQLRMMELVVTTGAIKRAQLQSNRHHQQINTQFFYRPDPLPVAQRTVSEHWRKYSRQVYWKRIALWLWPCVMMLNARFVCYNAMLLQGCHEHLVFWNYSAFPFCKKTSHWLLLECWKFIICVSALGLL